MIIKPPKPGLGFGFWDSGFWDLVWFGLGVAKTDRPLEDSDGHKLWFDQGLMSRTWNETRYPGSEGGGGQVPY